MIQIAKIQFNPFGENTYILYNDNKDCVIVDPGCSTAKECQTLSAYIEKNEFKPIMIVATHGHIDHVCGACYAVQEFKVPFAMHSDDKDTLVHNLDFAQSMGFDMDKVPNVDIDLAVNKQIKLGNDVIDVIHTPGHTLGGVCLYIKEQKMMLSGDTLFHGSIGRTDLPGGNYDTLINSILTKILPLGGDVHFFAGHGSDSTLANETQHNPFISEVLNDQVNPVYEN